jgi:hypothetical protein
MENKDSLPSTKDPATGFYTKPDESIIYGWFT